MNTSTLNKARTAKARVAEMLRDERALTGVGITRVDEGYAVKVNLTSEPDERLHIPREIDGVPVRVEITGAVKSRKP